MALREEEFIKPFTVFVGDKIGVAVYIGLQKEVFQNPQYSSVRAWFAKFLTYTFPLVDPKWVRFTAPDDGFAAPYFRYTPNSLKDYSGDQDIIGETNMNHGVQMTYFEVIPFGPEEYND